MQPEVLVRSSVGILFLAGAAAPLAAQEAMCSFRGNAQVYLSRQARAYQEIYERSASLGGPGGKTQRRYAVAPAALPRQNFIDDEVFAALEKAGVQAAPLTTDEEFVRRIHLDLTGRLPSPAEIRQFMADTNPAKRKALIHRLLYTPEFTDKWTMWLGDLVQNNATSVTSTRQIQGRNAFYKFLWSGVTSGRSLRDMVYEMIAASGNNYDEATGAAGFAQNSRVSNGPAQDTYDMMLVKTVTPFLGLGHYDCLLCHNGRGHLDQLSLWGRDTSRMEAHKMAAFFSRMRFVNWQPPANLTQDEIRANFYFNSVRTEDVFTGNYALNTNSGNRPNRTPVGLNRAWDPEYRVTGAKPPHEHWRAAFAGFLVDDPMFARNFANRLWKAMFNLGLAEPVEGLDRARLDPRKPPEAPWTFQATHPELLERLAQEFVRQNHSLREFLRLLAESTAYQLSSRYDGKWSLEYVPLFARHYARRLEAEEIHDAIVKATGVFTPYTIQFWGEPVVWAMQFQDTAEPRSNSNVATFLNLFLRGNRDNVGRSQQGSILQQLNLMNNTFVTSRTKVAASPVLRAVAQLANPEAMVEEMFLTFLSRQPTAAEKAKALEPLARATTAAARNAALEDLAWALTNKVDFLFSF
jgi:hypothetical protein